MIEIHPLYPFDRQITPCILHLRLIVLNYQRLIKTNHSEIGLYKALRFYAFVARKGLNSVFANIVIFHHVVMTLLHLG